MKADSTFAPAWENRVDMLYRMQNMEACLTELNACMQCDELHCSAYYLQSCGANRRTAGRNRSLWQVTCTVAPAADHARATCHAMLLPLATPTTSACLLFNMAAEDRALA